MSAEVQILTVPLTNFISVLWPTLTPMPPPTGHWLKSMKLGLSPPSNSSAKATRVSRVVSFASITRHLRVTHRSCPTTRPELPEDYEEARTEEAFVEYLNKRCGTHRAAGGLLNEAAGRHPEFDSMASRFVVATADVRDTLYKDAQLFARATGEKYKYYLKVMEKVLNGSEGYIEKEAARYVFLRVL
jgi:hypothetical protein